MAELTIQSAYDAYARYKKDVSDVSNALFFDWSNQIMRYAYRKLKEVEPNKFISETTFTVSADPQSSDLPSDFRDIDAVGCGLYEIDSDSKDTANRLQPTGHGRRDRGYYFDDNQITFTGIDDSTIYRLRYLPALTTIDALTDYFNVNTATGGKIVLEDEYLDYLVKAYDVLYSQWDEDAPMESITDQRFVRVMDEMLSTYSRKPSVYSIYNPSIIY